MLGHNVSRARSAEVLRGREAQRQPPVPAAYPAADAILGRSALLRPQPGDNKIFVMPDSTVARRGQIAHVRPLTVVPI